MLSAPDSLTGEINILIHPGTQLLSQSILQQTTVVRDSSLTSSLYGEAVIVLSTIFDNCNLSLQAAIQTAWKKVQIDEV